MDATPKDSNVLREVVAIAPDPGAPAAAGDQAGPELRWALPRVGKIPGFGLPTLNLNENAAGALEDLVYPRPERRHEEGVRPLAAA